MFTYFPAGSRSIGRIAEWAKALAAEIKTLGAGMRVALDMSDPDMLRALEGEGLEVIAAEPLMEHATVVKSPEEVACLIHAVTVAETGMARMRRALEPGMTESELFAVLEHTNIEMGGEWLDTDCSARVDTSIPGAWRRATRSSGPASWWRSIADSLGHSGTAPTFRARSSASRDAPATHSVASMASPTRTFNATSS